MKKCGDLCVGRFVCFHQHQSLTMSAHCMRHTQRMMRIEHPSTDVEYAAKYPLHQAVRDGDVAVVKTLIAAGCDVNQCDQSARYGGRPALGYAACGAIEITELLLQAGARVDGWMFCCLRQAINDVQEGRAPIHHRSVLTTYLHHVLAHGIEPCTGCQHGVLARWTASDIAHFKRTPAKRIMSLFLATGLWTVPEWCGQPWSTEPSEQGKALYAQAISRHAVELSGYRFMRARMTEICVALQDLELPVLLLVLLIEEACWLAGTQFRRFHTWSLAATVKHWRENQGVRLTAD